jgi:hypothetical protein
LLNRIAAVSHRVDMAIMVQQSQGREAWLTGRRK